MAVIYDPDSPAKAKISGMNWVQYVPLGFAGLGVLFLAGGLLSFVRSVVAPGAGRAWLMRRRRRRWAGTG